MSKRPCKGNNNNGRLVARPPPPLFTSSYEDITGSRDDVESKDKDDMQQLRYIDIDIDLQQKRCSSTNVVDTKDSHTKTKYSVSKRRWKRRIISAVITMVICSIICRRDVRRISSEFSSNGVTLSSLNLNDGAAALDDTKLIVNADQLARIQSEPPTITYSNNAEGVINIDIVSIGSDTRLDYVSMYSCFFFSY